jgi:hypothetical protein
MYFGIKFFKQSLERLKEARKCGFKSFQGQARIEQRRYLTHPLDVQPNLNTDLPLDKYSTSIYPTNEDTNSTPVHVMGDGNCAFRSNVGALKSGKLRNLSEVCVC